MSEYPDAQRARYANDPEVRKRRIAADRAYRKRNKTEINANARLRWANDPDYRKRRSNSNYARYLKRCYGLTLQQYQALLGTQKGRCAICKRKPRDRLQVDHCHRSKVIRRLLCGLCNRGLGLFRDDPRLLRSAAAYLCRALKAKPCR